MCNILRVNFLRLRCNMLLNPEDIDFAISDTFAGGLAQMHGWQVPERHKTLRELRFDADCEAIAKSREEMNPDSLYNSETLHKIFRQ